MAAWSNQPIRLVVGFTAGGSADFVARQLALYLAEELTPLWSWTTAPVQAAALPWMW